MLMINDIIPKLSASENIKFFTDCILKIYIASDSIFIYNILAKFLGTSNRTMTSCEPYHANLKDLFYTLHPNINFLLMRSKKYNLLYTFDK